MGNAECGIKNLRLEAMKEKAEAECGLRPIGAYAYAPAGRRKIKAKSRAHRAKRKEKIEDEKLRRCGPSAVGG